MGSKYRWAPDSNPPPGAYDINHGEKLTKPKSLTTSISNGPERLKKKVKEGPAPGQYDQHIKPFGSETKCYTIGAKYKWAPDRNPGPGSYNTSQAETMTKPRVKNVPYQNSPQRGSVQKKQVPGPGYYEGDMNSFGKNTRPITMGTKYRWSPDRNPGPGSYHPDESATKPRPSTTKIGQNLYVPLVASPKSGFTSPQNGYYKPNTYSPKKFVATFDQTKREQLMKKHKTLTLQ